MAMHKSKKTKRFQPGGLVDSEGNPVRDGSGNPIMTGSFPEEDEITARGRAKNAEMFKSLFNRATGRGKEAAPAASAKAPAAAPAAAPAVSKAPSASDGMDESDRRREAATKAPSRAVTSPAKAKPAVVTKEQLAKSGFDNLRDYMNAEKGLKRRNGAAATTAKDKPANQAPATPVNRARYTPEDSTPRQYMSPSYMRNLMREDMEKARAEIQPQRREEQKVSQRNKAEPNKYTRPNEASMKKGGRVTASSASKRADGIAQRGKTRGKVY
jgi:hypothetical protein